MNKRRRYLAKRRRLNAKYDWEVAQAHGAHWRAFFAACYACG